MRVLVTGGRNWGSPTVVRILLDAVWSAYGGDGLVVVHGHCPTGADAFADQWATEHADLGVVVERHPADWAHLHRAAGPIRNQEMVNAGADLCLAFIDVGSRGTVDCVRRAEKAGIRVRRFHSSALDQSVGTGSV